MNRMLAGFDITEEAMGCPVISSMDTVAAARFLFPSTDSIVIDRIGKDISGSGFRLSDPVLCAQRL